MAFIAYGQEKIVSEDTPDLNNDIRAINPTTGAIIAKNVPIELDEMPEVPTDGLVAATRFYLEDFGSKRNLDGLYEVIISGNYPETLRKISIRDNREVSRTNNTLGQGVAKAHRIFVDGAFRHSIIIDASIIASLLSDNEYQRAMARHLIAHELCHIEDANRLTEAKPRGWLSFPETYKKSILIGLSVTIWAEYYANRTTAETTAFQGEMYLEHLINAAAKAKDIIRDAMIDYRTEANLDKFFSTVLSYTNTMLTSSAYFLGYLDGIRDLGQNPDAVEEKMTTVLESLGFGDTWKNLSREVRSIARTYPNWSDLEEEMEPIIGIVEDLLEQYNVLIHDRGNHVYVELPLTPETCPSWPPPGW